MRILRVFVDASVFVGMFDSEFADDTGEFFRQTAAGRFALAVSEQVEAEIAPAPPQVRVFFRERLPSMAYFKALLSMDSGCPG